MTTKHKAIVLCRSQLLDVAQYRAHNFGVGAVNGVVVFEHCAAALATLIDKFVDTRTHIFVHKNQDASSFERPLLDSLLHLADIVTKRLRKVVGAHKVGHQHILARLLGQGHGGYNILAHKVRGRGACLAHIGGIGHHESVGPFHPRTPLILLRLNLQSPGSGGIHSNVKCVGKATHNHIALGNLHIGIHAIGSLRNIDKFGYAVTTHRNVRCAQFALVELNINDEFTVLGSHIAPIGIGRGCPPTVGLHSEGHGRGLIAQVEFILLHLHKILGGRVATYHKPQHRKYHQKVFHRLLFIGTPLIIQLLCSRSGVISGRLRYILSKLK